MPSKEDPLEGSQRSQKSSPENGSPTKTRGRKLKLRGPKKEKETAATLVAAMSLDAADSPPHSPGKEGRERAHTDPVDRIPVESVESEDDSTAVSDSKERNYDGAGETSQPVEEIVKNPSEDEEMKRAMAMALAIQNNPNMTPEEIRGLLAKDQIETTGPAVPVPQTAQQPGYTAPLIPGRLTDLMPNFPAIVASTTAAPEPLSSSLEAVDTSIKPSSSSDSKSTFRERARAKVNEAKSMLSSHIVKHHNSMPEDTPTSTKAGFDFRKQAPHVDTSSKDSGAGLRLPFRHNNQSRTVRTPPISPVPTDKPEITRAIELAPELPMEPSSVDQVATAGTAAVPPPPPPLPTSKKSAPIRISGVAWKRRGGMGKFSTTAAWERRRIELQGTRLLYYRASEDEEHDSSLSPSIGGDDIFTTMTKAALSLPSATAAGDDTQDQSAIDGVVVAKRANWLEQAASTWTSAGADDPTAARGYIDLAKEKATVHTAYGHSGAPSPFAISVKVRGETKWKLCFDYHRTQMEWFVALTDVVVQCSVDSYNKQLLQSVDPASQLEHAIFQPPSVAQPPTKDAADASAHRLWQTGPYSISSCGGTEEPLDSEQTNNDETEQSDDAGGFDVSVRSEGETDVVNEPRAAFADDTVAHAAVDASNKIWMIPENHLVYVVCVLNLALVYARASSTSMEGFWYLVILSNLGIYLCRTKEPDWRSIVSQARAAGNARAVRSRKTVKPGSVSAATAAAPVDEMDAPAKKTATGYIPVAGCSTVLLENTTDPPVNEKGEHFAGWRTDTGEDMMIRSHGYISTKAKVPSPGEMYELVNVDIFESPSRYPDMAPRVKLPEAKFANEAGPKTWRAPDTFIVSIALPTDPPGIGKSTSDGGGYTITMYYQMRQETRNILRRVTGDGYDPSKEKVDDPQKSQINAIRLFEEWCRRAPNDPKFQARFKVVPNAHNLKEIGMPGWISKYNGKPFLIKRPGQTGFLFNHPELSCMEFDISLHPFPYLAKQAICFMKDRFFKKVLVTFGFVIEGRADDELPECLIGKMQLCYPNPIYAIQAEDFFAGTCPRSF